MIKKRKILVVDDESTIREQLVRYLNKSGYEAIEAGDGQSALELFQVKLPDVVISDIMMPRMDGIALIEEIRSIKKNTIIILMTGFGTEEILLKALRKGANNFFKKPFRFEEVVDFINHVIQYRIDEDASAFFSASLTEETKHFKCLTGQMDMNPIINQIAIHLKNVFDEEEIINLKIGIEEMITNAFEHGNLGISYNEKSEALGKGKFRELLTERLSDKANSKKFINIESRLTSDGFSVTIGDEGRGFDWESLPKPSAENILSYNGRGILITKVFYDEVEYNNKGNSVTLAKYRQNDLVRLGEEAVQSLA